MRCKHGIIWGIALLIVGTVTSANASGDEAKYRTGAKYIHRLNRQMIDIIINDAFSPAVSSRIYAYANLAAYEASCAGFSGFAPLDGKAYELKDYPKPDPKAEYDWRVTSATALGTVASRLLFNYAIMDSTLAVQLQELAAETDPAVFERSKAFGLAVADRMIKRAKGDGYTKIQASAKYTFPKGEGVWRPTPKNFVEPLDPFISTVRMLTMKTPDEVPALPHIPFSIDPDSEFYKVAKHTYDVSNNLTEEEKAIALFWNDTPGTTEYIGHFMPTYRQVNPPGHWINITRLVCEQKNADLMHSIEAYALVSTSLFDGFLACWHTKYQTNVIRPVTYINYYIVGDTSQSTWKPLIDTPPFPEYPSGHSTVSAAAATVLTALFGEMEFTDSTEEEFGYGTRTFKNFMEAAQEASLSRVYGGIHYLNGCLNGTEHGVRIGQHVLKTLRTRS